MKGTDLPITLEAIEAELALYGPRVHPLDIGSFKEARDEASLTPDARARLDAFIAGAEPDIDARSPQGWSFAELWSEFAEKIELGVWQEHLRGWPEIQPGGCTPLGHALLQRFLQEYGDAPPRPRRPPAPLTLGAGFTEGALGSDGRPALAGEHEGPGLTLFDLALAPVAQFGPETKAEINCPILVDALRQKAYWSTGPVHALDLAAQTMTQISGPIRSLPLFLLDLAPDGTEAIVLSDWEHRGHVVRLRTDGGGILNAFELEGWDAGVCVSYASRRICQPSAEDGVRLLDFDGASQGAWPIEPPDHGPLRYAAFAPDGRSLAIGVHRGGLWIWRPFEAAELLDPEGSEATWSPDGRRLFYLRGDEELWTIAFCGEGPRTMPACSAISTSSWGACAHVARSSGLLAPRLGADECGAQHG